MKTTSNNEKKGISPEQVSLAVIILLGAFLRFYHLGATSIGNEYYAAAVKSMLSSWHNFFFVSFEPGGSISVDKPPLGFWLETLSAAIFGLNGFALAFPNALAGTLSIPLLYGMVRKEFGAPAGLAAGLALASMPIAIAAERNNTIDGMLVFTLLLACLAAWKAIEAGSLRYLLLSACIVGLGFNIKMLQAFMVLPAIYALYWFGAKVPWTRRLLHLGAASLVLLAVSLSWALIVDATPAAERPIIGSSSDNTVMELIVGHNGIKRLLGSYSSETGATEAEMQANPQQSAGRLPPAGGGGLAPLPRGGPQGIAAGKGDEVGQPGLLRLFNTQLAAQAAWLLALALPGLSLALLLLGRARPLSRRHLALILWAGWLLPNLLYFSFTGGLWHIYYLIMLGPPLAALTGVTVWAYGQSISRFKNGRVLVSVLSGMALGVELYILSTAPVYFIPAGILSLAIWLAGLALLLSKSTRFQALAIGLLLASLFMGPLLWSGLTTFNPQPEIHLPVAGPQPGQVSEKWSGSTLNPVQQKLLAYLLANKGQEKYLLATLDSYGASPFILASGQPVLTLGGFIGNDQAVSLSQLQELLASRQLRYVLNNNNLSLKADIYTWVTAQCQPVQMPGITDADRTPSQGRSDPRSQSFSNLYDCWK